MLGTFITEWGEGKEKCTQLFGSKADAEALAQQLVVIARYFGFEGWLIKIENDLSATCVQNLLHFLRSGMPLSCSSVTPCIKIYTSSWAIQQLLIKLENSISQCFRQQIQRYLPFQACFPPLQFIINQSKQSLDGVCPEYTLILNLQGSLQADA